ncbi:hypothetical protein [Flavobacterium johnsoniae]|uniref:Apea-like HEPN domain-containing protein n=1 Tax=Flavobacterium johnsoniae TaxID=986 RepID=A0A1M5JAM8_FLAJO|nr:hypothetical protein [Flavobacterium johnsoniae]SHG37612.1 hypothetical protein SAMN05444388_102448 [Flavobacterium johnsoniae]
MDIEIIIDRADLQIAIEKFFLEKLKNNLISIGIKVVPKDENKKITLVSDSSWIKLCINDSFILNHFSTKSEDYKLFVYELENFLAIVLKDLDKALEYAPSFSSFSVIYNFDQYELSFPFNFLSKKYVLPFEDSLKLVLSLLSNQNEFLIKSIKGVFDEGDNKRIFRFDKNEWNIINPLNIMSSKLNDDYRKNKDFRIKKPHILINRDNIFKYFVLDTNWVLVFDKLETLMIKPNDVSIYSNIAEKKLRASLLFYKKTILPRHKTYYGGFPSEEIQKEYFDYFELIIEAIIFSYTSLEAFANICIPDNHEYIIEKDGIKTIYSKEAIERKFSLREKFKNILKDILYTPDVAKTKWWNSFIELEDIRNEIIHSKSSKSEDRYSKLLQKKIFKIIEVNKIIIEYYGQFILENKKYLLNEFPYEFGYDDVHPGLMSNKNYEKSYKISHNINM